MIAIRDNQKREFKKLRVSLTGSCNYNCSYCSTDPARAGEKNCKEGAPNRLQSVEEFTAIIAQIHSLTELTQVRLTGGEPTLYPHLPQLVRALKETGIPRIAVTTNGSFRPDLVGELESAGLDGINLSLNALTPETYRRMSGGGRVDLVLKNLETIRRSRINLKLNTTVMRNINSDEILPLLEFAGLNGITIRFLELMQMGSLYSSGEDFMVSADEILEVIKSRHSLRELGRKKSDTTEYWETIKTGYRVGIIANNSAPFCNDCDRLRLDSRGDIYGCISSNQAYSIFQPGVRESDKRLAELLRFALAQKQEQKFSGSNLNMRALGG